MPNIQVTHASGANNARSESAIAINPNNSQQIVSASKSFRNIANYDFTLATQFSSDGGLTWQESQAIPIPGFPILSDPTLAWDDVGNVFLLGLSGTNPPSPTPIGVEAYKSTDGGNHWSGPIRVHTNSGDDKQWLGGDANAASPFHGRLYGAWDDTNAGGLLFARSLDGGATWVGTGATPTAAGTRIAPSSFAPEINVASNGDVYIVFLAGSAIQFVISRDGGDTFSAPVNAATGISPIGSPGSPHFPGENFRVGTLATACVFGQTVLASWADIRDGVSRIFFARSLDAGVTWVTPASGQRLLTSSIPGNFQHFDPQIVFDPNGVIGCAFYEFGPKPAIPKIDVVMAQSFDFGISFDHFTITDQPWDPSISAPNARGDPNITFIGDYFDIAANSSGFYPLWTDTRTGVQDLFTAIVPAKQCAFIVNRSTLGQDEVDARRNLPGGAVIADAFRVVADGFTAAELGISGSGASLPISTPPAGMTIVARGNSSATGDYGSEVQRFTFLYDINFGGDDTAFNFPTDTRFFTLSVSVGPTSAQALFELIKQPDPFILHGDPAWLSIDLRVFVVRGGESKFGVPGISGASDAPRFIQQLINTATPSQFDSLSTGEETSKLFLQPEDEHGSTVFNFALAKVHYIGLIGANQVRVFFRLFQAQTANLAFNTATDYRRAPTNPHGQPIALAGIQGAEYVTIPCFAEARVDSTVVGMAQQTDDANVRSIVAHSNGSEVDTLFGCWLDINQPGQNRLPVQVGANPDGPFNEAGNPALPIQQAILRSLHQCLVAEIAFDPTPIPAGQTPGNWDKLAQRNIAWADVGSAHAATTFEIRPTPPSQAPNLPPDELMIDWGNLPPGSTAFLYTSAVAADDILKLARSTRTSQTLTRIDDHTIGFKAQGIGYVPIPPRSGINAAALLSVELGSPLRRGEVHTVAVRQVTNAVSGVIGAVSKRPLHYRIVIGAFQLTIPVGVKSLLLRREERDLSVLRWIAQAIPQSSRWSLVFPRYVDEIAGRVKAFGGDPGKILPSPTGDGTPPATHHHEHEFTGKISGLIFDHFGDFEGFVLETVRVRHKFYSREKRMEELATRIWRERLRVTVVTESHALDRPVRLIVSPPAD